MFWNFSIYPLLTCCITLFFILNLIPVAFTAILDFSSKNDVGLNLKKNLHLSDRPGIICETNSYPPSPNDLVPKYVLDLDVVPALRWTALVQNKTEILSKLFQDVSDLIKSLAGERLYNYFYSKIGKIAETLPEPYYEEIKGIAIAAKLPLEQVTIYNIFYEFYVLCTSIIAQDSLGNVFHGRNLDNGALLGWDSEHRSWRVTDSLKPLAVEVDWRRGGKTIFKSVNFAGFVGVLTAVKEDKFSFSINKRMAWNNGLVGLFEWILLHDHHQHWVSLLGREVLENAESYQEAKEKLSKSRLLAPVYYILAGVEPYEGVIITRDRDNVDVLQLGSNSSCDWFLVQTNYDHWSSPPFFDNRRQPASQCLKLATKNLVSKGSIYNVLSTRPVLNKSTVYTSLMHAKNGTIDTWKRYCPEPCFPWFLKDYQNL